MNNSVQIAVDILLALLTGGILLFFLEVMHLGVEVSREFKSVMNPFYHRLSRFMVFLDFYRYALIVPKDNKACDEFKSLIERIARSGLECIMTGRDMSYQNAKDLDTLCESINHIWYSLDRFTEVKQEITIDYTSPYDVAIEAISEVFPRYKGKKADRDLLYEASGAFYSSVWEPVQHCTSNYEYFLEEEKSTRRILLIALLLICLSLLCIMMYVDSFNAWLPCALTIMSSIVFAVSMWKLSHVSSLSKRIIRSTRSEMKESYLSLGDVCQRVARWANR